MTSINLLPWREERREELKQQFFVVLVGVALIGAGVVYLVDKYVQSSISYQKSRNGYIEEKITSLDKRIEEIKTLKSQREALEKRMLVIQSLQGNRPVIVRIFDELAKTIPDGVFLTSLEKRGPKYAIKGKAESNNKVSNFMRNLDDSEWFKDPKLSKVQQESRARRSSLSDKEEEVWSVFDLSVSQEVSGEVLDLDEE